MATRQSSSLLFALMALLTLGMVIVLPVINQPPNEAPPPEITPDPNGDYLALDFARTALVYVEGDTFTRGTTSLELQRSVVECRASGGECTAADGADSLPAHPVTVSGFWMEVHEVTYAQYVHFLNALGPGAHLDGCDGQPCALTRPEEPSTPLATNGSAYSVAELARADFPVTHVTWYGAAAYCEALGRRLPSEAEWEFAARGPDGDLYPWGDTWEVDAANVLGGEANELQSVGGYVEFASRDGIRDLTGNVAEWVADWYTPDFYSQPEALVNNPVGPETGTLRVVRGGSWDVLPFFARSAQRAAADPLATSATVGFRCVADE